MRPFSSRNHTNFAKSGRLRAVLSSVSLSVLLVSCGPTSTSDDETSRMVQRQSVFRDLYALEKSLEQNAAPMSSPQPNLYAQFRTSGIKSAAEFEGARNRRILAFEGLANMAAPAETADDFGSFWEIHQAYRHAVETSRFGHGHLGLVYTRPYPADHLSGPLVDLIARVETERTAYPEDVALIADNIRILNRRLKLDLSAGLAPPYAVIDEMISQIDASPFADTATLEAARQARSGEGISTEEESTNPFDEDALILLDERLVEAVSELRGTLNALKVAHESETPPSGFGEEFYAAAVAQASSGVLTPQSCMANAKRYEADVYPRLLALLDRSEAVPEGSEAPAVNSEGKSLSERFVEWQARAPLFPPEEIVETDPETSAVPETEETEPAPYQSPEFIAFSDAMLRMEEYWSRLIGRNVPGFDFAETDAVEPPYYRYGPPPKTPPGLRVSRLKIQVNDNLVTISAPELEQLPISLALFDAAFALYPGMQLPDIMKENREDLPLFARELHNAAFDLGWPHFAIFELSNRGAFEDAPRLEAARLFRFYELAVRAEVDTALGTGKLSYEEATQLIAERLDIAEADAETIALQISVEPGLACGELAGLSRLVALKLRAEGVLGDRFNIRDFNDVVLGPGSRPLDLVERDVDAWLTSKVSR